jgi:hypothetical protein
MIHFSNQNRTQGILKTLTVEAYEIKALEILGLGRKATL